MIIELTPQAQMIVQRLHSTGLYGNTLADVCERIFYDKLRELDDDDDGNIIPSTRGKPPPRLPPAKEMFE